MTPWKPGTWRDWAAMARLPNLPTVWSNVFTAWVLCGLFAPHDGPDPLFWFTMAGWTFLYAGGAILNDVRDVAYDRVHRPERALPAGRVSRGAAGAAAAILLAAGFLLGPGLLVVPLILLYTWIHKQSDLTGALLMGLCRMMIGLNAEMLVLSEIPFPVHALFFAWWMALTIYVIVISLTATFEAKPRVRQAVGWMLAALPLLDAGFLLAAGLAVEAALPLASFALVLVLRREAAAT